MTRSAVSRSDVLESAFQHLASRGAQGHVPSALRALKVVPLLNAARAQFRPCADLTDAQCRAIVADVRGVLWPDGDGSEEWGSDIGEWVAGVDGLRPPALR